MARVWNNVTNLENIKNRTILQLLENQTKLLEEYSKEIDRIEGIAESAENKAAAAQTAAEGAQTNAQQAAQSAQAAASSASAAQSSANEARIAANEAMADAERAANEAEDAQQSASSAASSAASAADKANTAAADAASAKATAESAVAGTSQNTTNISLLDARVGGLETNYTALQGRVNGAETTIQQHGADIAALERSQEKQDGSISQLESQVTTAQEGVNQINARETGYGETLSISGSNLSLMHGATALSTVTLPGGGGGSEIVARPLTGWKVQNQTTSLDIKNAYYVPISDNIWYVCGKILHATQLSGNVGVRIIPPDAWGTPALVIGEVALGKADSYSRTLPIISQPSGTSADVIGVVPTPAKPGGLVNYESEGLYSFFFMAIRNAGV